DLLEIKYPEYIQGRSIFDIIVDDGTIYVYSEGIYQNINEGYEEKAVLDSNYNKLILNFTARTHIEPVKLVPIEEDKENHLNTINNWQSHIVELKINNEFFNLGELDNMQEDQLTITDLLNTHFNILKSNLELKYILYNSSLTNRKEKYFEIDKEVEEKLKALGYL
ncbi:MAG: hypothetical protein AABW46_02945, partial [Nanoarchaeota archaeon]